MINGQCPNMLIGIDASRANRPIKTGVEWYAFNLIENLKKIDNTNQYFLYSDRPLEGDLKVCPANFFERILWWLPVRFWTLIRLTWEMKFSHNKPEILFVPAHTIPLANPRFSVVTMHDIGFARFPEYYHWADKLYHNWTAKFIKKNATKIITVSEFSKREIMEVYGIEESRIVVIPISYNEKAFKRLELTEEEKKNKLKEQYGLDAPFFLFVSRLEKKKNVEGLISAFLEYKKRHPEDKHKLVLAGKKGLSFEEIELNLELSRQAQDIKFLDYINVADMVLLYNTADLFVFPSFYEGFGIPPLEAMACGCPVVCSNAASLPEVVGEAAIKFNPHNQEAIIKAIETVVDNPEVKEMLIESGYEQIKKFSWEKTARETLKVFENLG